jgi:hypothetical protein
VYHNAFHPQSFNSRYDGRLMRIHARNLNPNTTSFRVLEYQFQGIGQMQLNVRIALLVIRKTPTPFVYLIPVMFHTQKFEIALQSEFSGRAIQTHSFQAGLQGTAVQQIGILDSSFQTSCHFDSNLYILVVLVVADDVVVVPVCAV